MNPVDEWFKARLNWGDAIMMLSDSEAGRFIKAVFNYANGKTESAELSGNERFLFAIASADMRRDSELREEVSKKRSEAGALGGRPKAKKAIASFAKQNKAKKANAYSKNKEQEKETEKESESESSAHAREDDDGDVLGVPAAELRKRQEALDGVLDLCEAIGLRGERNRGKAASLVADFGAERVTQALNEAADHISDKAPPWSYVEAVLRNGGKKKELPPGVRFV